MKCGARGTEQIRLLAKPCQPPNDSRQRTISKILEGKLPQGLTHWPDDK